MLERKVYVDYNDVKGMDLAEARKEISFPTQIEKVQSVDSNKILNKSILFNVEGGNRFPIGFVSDRRKIIPYGDLMDIVTKELDNIIDYKLIETSVSNKAYNFTQRYLLNHEINNPDGLKLAPMLIVNYSYTSLPMSLELGTFRYVCSNGAMVKVKDFDKISIRMHDLNTLYVQNIGNLIRRGIDNIDKVSDVYAKLATEDWKKYLVQLMRSPYVSVGFKKAMADYLTLNRDMYLIPQVTIKNDTFMNLKFDGNTDLVDADGNIIYSVQAQKSAWDFYNDCTDVSSHTSPSIALRRKNDLSISTVFAA